MRLLVAKVQVKSMIQGVMGKTNEGTLIHSYRQMIGTVHVQGQVCR